MEITRLDNKLSAKVQYFFTEQWGSSQMVISSGVYDCSQLDGFAALDEEDNIVGLITFDRKETELEIISLDSLLEGRGIGGMLLKQVERLARTEQRHFTYYDKRQSTCAEVLSKAGLPAIEAAPERGRRGAENQAVHTAHR